MHNKIGQGYATNVLKAKQPNGKTAEQRKEDFCRLIETAEQKGKRKLLRPIKRWLFSLPSFKKQIFCRFHHLLS